MCVMGFKWNMVGDMIIVFRRRMLLVFYYVRRIFVIVEFYYFGYSNVCIMKSNCFVGSKD